LSFGFSASVSFPKMKLQVVEDSASPAAQKIGGLLAQESR
jgi:hypothetical protein